MFFSKLRVFAMCATAGVCPASVTYNVSNYTGRSENPFLGMEGVVKSYVEDFETQAFTGNNILTTPNASGWNGSTSGSPFWGVREDYDLSDPDGGLGWRWTSRVQVGGFQKDPPGIHFDFTPDADGRFPDFCGAALVGLEDSTGVGGFNSIFVYDKDGNEVTGGLWKIPKPIADPNLPAEDLFLNFEGIYVPGGISRIHFRDFTEVDHLTYAYSVPEPGAWFLVAASLLVNLRWHRNLMGWKR